MPTKPIRVDATVFGRARAAAKVHHRSTTGQLEYWADLGRRVEAHLGPMDVLHLMSGSAKLQVIARESTPVTTDAVVARIDAMREAGALHAVVAPDARFRYQASSAHPGYLERIDSDGNKEIGRFYDGDFVQGL